MSRSMDELDPVESEDPSQRPTVKELVARIQQQQSSAQNNTGNNSESSDDEDSPMRMTQYKGPMADSNMASPITMPNYENVPNDAPPRSRSGVYSPTINTALVDSNTRYIEPIVKIQESNIRYNDTYARSVPSTSRGVDQDVRYVDQNYRLPYYDNEMNPAKYYDHNPKYVDLNSRFAKLRMLDGGKGAREGSSRMLDSSKMFESTTRMLENPQDTADRDTNNDSGYSTKVYGSSKGNSPSLSGQIDNECLGASSLV